MPRGNGDSGVTSTQIGMETRGSLCFSVLTAELKGGATFKRSVTDKEERQPCLGSKDFQHLRLETESLARETGKASLLL